MPFIFEHKPDEDYTIIGFHIDSIYEIKTLKRLNRIDGKIPAHIIKAQEFICSRYLLTLLCERNKIDYQLLSASKKGKLFLPDASLSLTHSYPYVFAALDKKKRMIGIDLEKPRNSLLQIAPRVFSSNELMYMDNSILKACHLWICKEAAYKCNDEIKSFKNDIKVKLEKGEKPTKFDSNRILDKSLMFEVSSVGFGKTGIMYIEAIKFKYKEELFYFGFTHPY